MRHVPLIASVAAWLLLLSSCWVLAQPANNADSLPAKSPAATGKYTAKSQGPDRKGGRRPSVFVTDVPPHPVDIVLGRPTNRSVTLSVLTYQEVEGYVAYGMNKDSLTHETPRQLFTAGKPVELLIESLQPNTRYCYQFFSRMSQTGSFVPLGQSAFQTARPPQSQFTFVVQADPHLDENTIPARYHRSMLNMCSDNPDFLVDLGDTFMTGKYRDNRVGAEKHYLAQRYDFGTLGQSAAIFLVLGNHDGEGNKGRRLEPAEIASGGGIWANATRKKYFPNPTPNEFYSGNATPHPEAGLLQDYYAWEWGDALFVALDPYWFDAPAVPELTENWHRTLGREQYDWFRRTVEKSQARFKFVFIHHLVGGATPEGRGGAEAAEFFEWGGKNFDRSDGFKHNRPGWPEPIHDMLVKNGVTIVFHGHDHMFARQERDGVVYQCVPQPGNRGNGTTPSNAAEYSYLAGAMFGSPGYMRVQVTADKVRADLVRSYLPADETVMQKNYQVDYSYVIPARESKAVSHEIHADAIRRPRYSEEHLHVQVKNVVRYARDAMRRTCPAGVVSSRTRRPRSQAGGPTHVATCRLHCRA